MSIREKSVRRSGRGNGPAKAAHEPVGARAAEISSLAPAGRAFRPVVLLLFLVSGATGLVFEVAWARVLGTVFGNTVQAASTVLTAYMLGLALGSVTLGRLADRLRRPLALYGLLELGTGLYAMAVPILADSAGGAYGWLFRSAPAALTPGRFVLSLLILLPPTFLMGGTLPVLGRHLERQIGPRGRQVGYLYGANTLGAVAGCFLAGFVLLEALGVRGSLMAAGLTAAGVGTLALVLAAGIPSLRGASLPPLRGGGEEKGGLAYRGLAPPAKHCGPYGAPPAACAAGSAEPLGEDEAPPVPVGIRDLHAGEARAARSPKPLPAPAAPAEAGPASLVEAGHETGKATFRLVLLAFAATGFCALACEVLWTRLLIFVLATSAHAFASMLTVFLAGLALGSLVSARWLMPRARRGVLWFGVIELLAALAVLGSLFVLSRLHLIDLWLAGRLGWAGRWALPLGRFADAAAVLLAPTLLMGAAMPIVTRACLSGGGPVGRHVGQLYAANTVGCVLGAFAAGFLLLPGFGSRWSLLAVAGLNAAVGAALVMVSVRSLAGRLAAALPAGAVAAAMAFAPADLLHGAINTYHHPSRLAFLKEDAAGTVAVHDLPNGERLISVDGVNVAGLDFMLRSTQKLQGYIPLLLHPNPRRVVQIGFGSGETARVGLAMGVPHYSVVEICPAVLQAGPFFRQVNAGSYEDPRIARIIADGKNFARLSGGKFDVVMNDSTYPGCSGSSALYTVDHFRHCRQRLAEGGLLSCWVPLDLHPQELRMILRSFREVFPHCSLWVASNCLNKHALILGSLTPLRIDVARLRQALARPGVAEDLAAIAIHDVYDLLDCHILDEHATAALTADAPLNTDDMPRLEFHCAARVRGEYVLKYVLSMIVAPRAPVVSYVAGLTQADRAELDRRFAATNYVFRAQIAQLYGEPEIRRRQLELALTANSAEAHVASCQAELQREIGDLHTALTAMPTSLELAVRLADKCFVAGHYEQAVSLYEQLARQRPSLAPCILERLARLRFRAGAAGEAEQLLRRCLELFPQSAEAHDLLAGICLKDGRLDEARRHIDQALRLAPDNPYYRDHERVIAAATQTVRPTRRISAAEP